MPSHSDVRVQSEASSASAFSGYEDERLVSLIPTCDEERYKGEYFEGRYRYISNTKYILYSSFPHSSFTCKEALTSPSSRCIFPKSLFLLPLRAWLSLSRLRPRLQPRLRRRTRLLGFPRSLSGVVPGTHASRPLRQVRSAQLPSKLWTSWMMASSLVRSLTYALIS
jgi:hypothetical protein